MGFTENNGSLTFAPAPDGKQPKPGKSWVARHKAATAVLAFVGIFGVAAAAGGGTPAETAAEKPATSQSQPAEPAAEVKTEPKTQDEPAAEPQEAEPVKPSMTRAQENAADQAESYLDMSAFSRSGLIKQLEFEGYSKSDATYGVDSVDANWTEQADKKAEEYLAMSSFSRSGLIDQLEFEGFTAAQAKHGATAAGL